MYFQYHLNCQDISDKWGDIEICLMESNRKIVSAGWTLKFDQINFNWRNLSLTWMQLKKEKVYFQYHLNCQDITDKWGDIELCLAGSNRETVSASWQLKFDQSNVIQRNLLLSCMQLNKESVFSISPQLSGYYWQMRWYWNLSNGIKSEDCICWLSVEIRSKQRNSKEFVTKLHAINKKKVYFQ